MEYTLLGRTGVRVSRLALGTATFGVAPQEQDAIKLVHRALDLGINFFDTAVTYGNQPPIDTHGPHHPGLRRLDSSGQSPVLGALDVPRMAAHRSGDAGPATRLVRARLPPDRLQLDRAAGRA